MPARRPFSCVPPDAGRNAVDVAADVLVGGLGPLQHQLHLEPVLLFEREGRFVHGLGAALADDLLQVVGDAFGVLEGVLLPCGLVVEDDLDAAMEKARHFEPLADDGGVELDFREDGRVGSKEHRRPAAARRASLLEAAGRLALLEGHLPLRPVAPDGGHELARERVDDAGADAVEAAGGLVVARLEFSTGVEHGEDHFERALLGLGVDVDGDAAAVVFDGDRRSVLVERDPDVGGITVHRLVDGVVERLPHEVMQAGAADAADVHARAFPYGLEAFEYGDVFCGV